MGKIFITGSADGLGQLCAKALIDQGHRVVVHARNAERARDAMKKNPNAETVLIGNLTDLEETKKLALEVNKLGAFDAVIHNAGVYQVSAKEIFAVNTMAPYVLTCLINKPKRLIYLSSGMHLHGSLKIEDLKKDVARATYSDSKFHMLLLCMAITRKWPEVFCNAVNPGWVPTKMGGRGAPDDLQKGYETQVWLATSNDQQAKQSGRYFFHQKERSYNPDAGNIQLQEKFLNLCEEITGVPFPQ